MRVNTNKSKVIHYRIKSQDRTKEEFIFGSKALEVVSRYKYLGLVLDEFLNYETTAAILSESGGRALGAVYSKFKHLKGLGYNTYTKLYNAGVTPILDYCSGVWGYTSFDKINTIQNRAIRFYLGVHKFAPNLAINGDMGWTSCRIRRKIAMLKLWNRFLVMDDNRLTKKIFVKDKQLCKNNWSADIKKVFEEIDLLSLFEEEQNVNIDFAKSIFDSNLCELWKTDIVQVPKLRTYCTFKSEYNTEPYVRCIWKRSHRSLMAQFRSGILPLRIETGRYQNIPREFRLCLMCNENVCEDETHFMFDCALYDNIRCNYFSKLTEYFPDFTEYTILDKLTTMMNENVVKFTASYIWEAYSKRREVMYK